MFDNVNNPYDRLLVNSQQKLEAGVIPLGFQNIYVQPRHAPFFQVADHFVEHTKFFRGSSIAN